MMVCSGVLFKLKAQKRKIENKLRIPERFNFPNVCRHSNNGARLNIVFFGTC